MVHIYLFIVRNYINDVTLQRPKGVPVISILYIIVGFIPLIAGIFLIEGIPIIENNPQKYHIDPNSVEFKIATSWFGYLMGGGFITLGIAKILIGNSLRHGKHWAWKIAIVLVFISIAIDTISIGLKMFSANITGPIIDLIIAGMIIYYLYKPNVKLYFGETVSTGAPSPPI